MTFVLLVVDLSLIATPAPKASPSTLSSTAAPTKADLTVAVAQNSPRPMVLFARKRPDTCGAPATPVEVVYSLEELGLASGQAFSLANPLGGR